MNILCIKLLLFFLIRNRKKTSKSSDPLSDFLSINIDHTMREVEMNDNSLDEFKEDEEFIRKNQEFSQQLDKVMIHVFQIRIIQ